MLKKKKSVPGVEFHSIKCYNDFSFSLQAGEWRTRVRKHGNKLEYNLQKQKKK